MFLWFAGLSFLAVLVVFSSPAIDFRMVMLGAVLPVAEAAIGGPWLLHTLLGACIALTAVMLATKGRRLTRRRWLGLPIGLFMHLVLDGSWTDAKVFWWPFLGTQDVLGTGNVIEISRSWTTIVVMEIIGALALGFLIQRLDLLGEGRQMFKSSGQLLRSKLDSE